VADTSQGQLFPTPDEEGSEASRDMTMGERATLGARITNRDLYNVLQSIKGSNDRIAANSMSMSKYLEAHTKNLQQTEGLVKATRHQAQASGHPTSFVTRETLVTPELQQRVEREFQQRRAGGAFSDLSDQELEDRVTRQIAAEATKRELTRAQGARKLQDINVRELATPAGLAKRTLSTFGLEGLISGGGRGFAGGVEPQEDLIGDALAAQRAQTMRRGIGDRAAGALGRGAAMRGGIGGATAGLASRAALFAIPFAGQALVLTEMLNMLGLGVPAFSQIGSTVRGMRQQGALTGEGIQAGFRARMDARELRSGGLPFAGLNPFDPITDEIATQIVESVRTAGFTGDRARELYSSVASVYRDLGLSVETTTNMIRDATRVGGESLEQIVSEMKSFDSAAKSLGMNINEYAQSVQDAATGFRAGGAGASSTALGQQFVAGAPRILREGAGFQAYQGIFERAQPFLAARLGIPQQYLGLEQNVSAVMPAFEAQIKDEINRMPGENLAEKAANASRFGILLRGVDVPQIEELVKRIGEGRGPTGQAALGNVRSDYNQRVMRSMRGEVRVGDVYRMGRGQPMGDVLREHNITEEEYRRIQQLGVEGKLDARVQTRGSMENVNRDELAHHRLTALNRLRGVLTPEQRGELQRHLRERGYNFAERLQAFENQGRQVGDSVNVNGVQISI
jgi:hypothetical protein